MIGLPYGGLRITGGADTLALSTSYAKMASWSATGGANSVADSNSRDGDPAIVPDKANNRIKVNSPGIYQVSFQMSVDADGANDVYAKLYKNGSAVGEGLVCKQHVTTDLTNMSFTGIVEVLASDSPDTLPTFADPDSTAGVGKPAGGFGGAGAAPKTLSYLEVYLASASGTPTVTFLEATLVVTRLG